MTKFFIWNHYDTKTVICPTKRGRSRIARAALKDNYYYKSQGTHSLPERNQPWAPAPPRYGAVEMLLSKTRVVRLSLRNDRLWPRTSVHRSNTILVDLYKKSTTDTAPPPPRPPHSKILSVRAWESRQSHHTHPVAPALPHRLRFQTTVRLAGQPE